MFELFKIMGTVGLNNSDANSALDETTNKADSASKSIGERMQEGLGKAQKAIGNAGAGMTKWVSGPIVAATAGVFALLTKTGDYADRVLDLHDITGLSTDSIQEWAHVADIAGVSNEAVTNAVAGLVRRLPQLETEGGKANEAMEKLGLSYKDLSKLSPDEQVDTLMNALSEMEDPLERNAAGSQLFGGAWQDLAPILSMGADEIAHTREEAHNLNKVMSEEGLQDANAFRQEMERLKGEFAGTFRELATKFLPIFRDQILPILRDQLIPMVGNFADRISNLITWFNNLDPSVQKNILRFVGILAAAGPVLLIISKIIGVVSTAIGIFTGMAKVLAVAKGAFLLMTGPIGLVVAAVVAAIAIGVALYKNWDTVKAKASELWSTVTSRFNAIRDGARNAFEGVRKAIENPINRARDAVQRAIDRMKGFFNFNWSLPKIKMPRFSVSGSANPLNWLKEGVPKINVDWFAQGGIMERATAFGMNGNSVQVGGEAGREAVLPLNSKNLAGIGAGIAQASGFDLHEIKQMLQGIMNELRNIGDRPVIVNVTLDGKVIARVIQDPLDKENGRKVKLIERGLTRS